MSAESVTAPRFPFTAVVGQDRLKLALILSAVSPSIGGVLIRGEKGTAKSTVVRGLGPLLADDNGAGRVVELPIGATEDRVIGSLDLTKVLRDGAAHFTPGLLAQADGGVLYIDEVNLLSDHLVDVLLDAAASGRVTIERDGISHTQAADFVLVGTMNPEEGELRPQLLDRFGLVVDVAGPRDVDERVAVVTARMRFDAGPEEFISQHADAEAELAARIADARGRVHSVELPRAELRRISAICAQLEIDGLRGDIVIARTAAAHAAWRGADEVTADDVRVAAELALPHRQRRTPFDDSDLDRDQLENALESGEQAAADTPPPNADDSRPDDLAPEESDPEESDPEESDPEESDPEDSGSEASGPEDRGSDEPDPDGDDDPSGPGGGAHGPEFGTGTPVSAGSRVAPLRVSGVGDGDAGRRSSARSRRGFTTRAIDFTAGTPVHLFGTVLAAAGRSTGDGLPSLVAADLRGAERIGQESNLVVFVVDLSGSMTARRRLDAVRGACVDLLRDSYTRRDRVAVVVAAGRTATTVVPPTRSVDIALGRLSRVRTGGRTPLAEGLLEGVTVIERAARIDPTRRGLLVVLTDGRATAGLDAPSRANAAADVIARRHIPAVVVDCEEGMVRLGGAVDLARRMNATQLPMAAFTGGLTGTKAS